jgi:hypothetical protein
MIRRLASRSLALLLAALLLQGQAFAAGAGTSTGQLLKLPLGTRAIGMGEAFTAMADDTSALYWNPAGMSLLQQKEVTFMHSSLIESINYEHLAFVAPGDSYAFGGQFSYLGYGDIAGYDNNDVPTGDVNAYAYVANAGISRLITDSLSVGLSGGLIHETLADASANTFAANVGALYLLPTQLWHARYRLGLAAQNLGPGLKFINERDPLPRRYKLGLAAEGLWQLPLNLTTDLTLPNDNDLFVSVGSEYWFRDLLALRLGYAGSNDEGRGLRLGFGLKYASLLFDYAYAGYGDFGAENRVALSFRFGQKVRQLNGAERAILKEAKRSEKQGAYVPAIMAYNELLDKDPSNDHILRYMINAHDKMAKDTASTEVVQQAIPVPSPEDAALAELSPEDGPEYAQNTLPGAASPAGEDPLGLNALPEASALDAGQMQPTPSPAEVMDAPTPQPSDANSPALSPSDIYGN